MAGAVALLPLSLMCLLCLESAPLPASSGSSGADELTLLSFKSMLSTGPSGGLLASWNTSSHYCTWPGIVCSRRHRERVVRLYLRSSDLSGHISPFLSNLSFLRELDLGGNQLVGEIPPELGRLSKLQYLDLSNNSLQGTIPSAIGGCKKLEVLGLTYNQLHGEIPLNISTSLIKLTYLDLEENRLSGEIPPSLAGLSSIRFLYLDHNKLSGEIPPALGNLTNLRELWLSSNHLSGAVPSSLGRLPRLAELFLGANNLTGEIPASVWNISSLKALSVWQNKLTGTMPLSAFEALLNLEEIDMDDNQLHGQIPTSLGNASNLGFVKLTRNYFSGTVPLVVGRLRYLKWLYLSDNLLEAKEPRDWKFLDALTNCSQLRELELDGCKLDGVLPNTLSNLSSSSLTIFSIGFNNISGGIPRDIGNLINLEHLFLKQNSFTGSLPSSFSRLKSLQNLDLTDNKFAGSVLAIGNLTELIYLDLGINEFGGTMPSTLANLTKLIELDFGSNNFTGLIPRDLFHTPKHWLFLNISHNNMQGSLPQEMGNLKDLVQLSAEWNMLSGEIPATLGECLHLQYLFIQNNQLRGSIPSALSQLKGLETLDLSWNKFSGEVPTFLGNLDMLYYLNLSFNSFVGEVPTIGVFSNLTAVSIQGNNRICGGISGLHLPPCALQSPKKKHKFVVILVAASLTTILAILLLLCKLLSSHSTSKYKIPSAISIHCHPMVSYSQLVRATDGFSTANLLGSGAFGSVYKGELDGQAGECINQVAVKVLKLQTQRALKSFIAECEALRNLRHRNIVKIITFCSSIDTRGNDFKAIVYDLMPNGSLEDCLHPDMHNQAEQTHLSLRQRVTILLNVAYAVDYLHCHAPTPTVHCDIKSSNVLLDVDMVAHLGDFGLARILDGSSILQQSTSSMGIRGTIGYAAPEYGAGNAVSTQGDIYSYGILVLEMVTGKRPTDSKFRPGLSIREYVELGLCGRTIDVVDVRLCMDLENDFQTANAPIDSLISLLRLGMCCSVELPASRMSTEAIIKELHAIKESLEGIQKMNM